MKILLGIDDSKCSEQALETLMKQYKAAETEVLVLHAIESVKLMPPSYSYGLGPAFAQDYTTILQEWRRQGTELAARAVDRLRTAGFTSTAHVGEGDARELILDWAKNWHPDVILLGSHGRRGLDRLLLGSVAEFITHHAPCSVEIVRAPASAA